jgi:hypothetical protein
LSRLLTIFVFSLFSRTAQKLATTSRIYSSFLAIRIPRVDIQPSIAALYWYFGFLILLELDTHFSLFCFTCYQVFNLRITSKRYCNYSNTDQKNDDTLSSLPIQSPLIALPSPFSSATWEWRVCGKDYRYRSVLMLR